MEKKLSIKENMIWNSIGNFVYLFFQWLITILIVKISGFSDAGIFSLAMSITNVFYCISTWGIRNYQVSDVQQKYGDREYIKSRIITCIFSFIICIIFINIGNFDIKKKYIIGFYMLFKISEAIADVLHGIDQKAWRMDYIGKSFLYRGIITFIIFISTLHLSKNIVLSIFLMTISSFCIVVIYDYNKSKKFINYIIKKSSNSVRKLLVECTPLASYLLMSTAISAIPRYYLEQLENSERLGVYASIATPAVVVQVASTYLVTPIVTPISEYLESKKKSKFISLFNKCVVTLVIISIGAIIAVIIFGKLGLRILFGQRILPYAYLLLPVIYCTILTAFSWFFNMILTVLRDFKILLIGNLIGLLISIISSPFMIKTYSMNGVSFAFALSLLIQVIISIVYIRIDISKNFSQ